jgi:hypothetical protein
MEMALAHLGRHLRGLLQGVSFDLRLHGLEATLDLRLHVLTGDRLESSLDLLLHLLLGDGYQLWTEARALAHLGCHLCGLLRLLVELLLLLLELLLLLLLELQLLLWIHGTEQSLHRKRKTYSLDLKSLRNTSLTQLV